ncbi:hypothetical protein HQ865_05790 [Mucilaginibacter mali]|uniref:Class I SAM-dependent methyltransferase n=1 Tax=Mucilaginibacter mali TaxID=2740462 RepID=A0A7D4PZX4_9SPHI|nr:hypothetical protein [Mucilaginibacter mali]QKJ29286.1 hypothetical protein HQ865_05790 [Mucilaginibacter mali]
MINSPEIFKIYESLCATPSDINELLPHLRRYAEKCSHITEMGVREPTSTYAFLAGKPVTLISYDIKRLPGIATVENLAPGTFKFILKDVLKADIEETDFLFIDTFHTATQLERELARHADKAKRYIGFHDTAYFWNFGEAPYPGMTGDICCGRGLKYAIMPFLAKGGWKISFMTDDNNGLLIIERKAKGLAAIGQQITHLKYMLYILTKRPRHLAERVFARLFSRS